MLTLKHLEALADETPPLDSLKSLATACGCSDAIGGVTRRTKSDMINDIHTALLASTEDLSTMAKDKELKKFIDKQKLPVSKQMGGRNRRTKDDMLAEIVLYLAKTAAANAATIVAEAEADPPTPTPSAPSAPSTPTSQPTSTSPLCVADLGLLLSPGDAKCKLAALKGIGRAQQLENVEIGRAHV